MGRVRFIGLDVYQIIRGEFKGDHIMWVYVAISQQQFIPSMLLQALKKCMVRQHRLMTWFGCSVLGEIGPTTLHVSFISPYDLAWMQAGFTIFIAPSNLMELFSLDDFVLCLMTWSHRRSFLWGSLICLSNLLGILCIIGTNHPYLNH